MISCIKLLLLFFLLKNGLNKKTLVSSEPVFVLYHFRVVKEHDVQKLTSTPPVVIIITNTITEMEHHFHTLCLLLHVCKFLGTRESFCKRKEFNPPRNFFVDQTKTWLPGFYCFGTSCEVRWKWSIRTILHRNTRKYKVWQNIGKE